MNKNKIKIFAIFLVVTLSLCNCSLAEEANYIQEKLDNGIAITTMNFETMEEKQEIFKTENNTKRNLMSSVAKYTNCTEAYNPCGNVASTFKLIGDDERVRINNTSVFPYSTVAYMNITFPNGSVQAGTAFMIYKNVALTAGHCLYNSSKGGWATSVTIYPGKNGPNNNPFGSVYVSADNRFFYHCNRIL